MGIMDSFRNFAGNNNLPKGNASGQIPQQQQQVNQQQQVPQQQPGGVNNPANPQGNNSQQTPARDPNRPPMESGKEGDPQVTLDDFNSLWETPKDEKGNPVNQPKDTRFRRPKLDKTKLQPVIDKMDFTSGLNQELVGKALGGDHQALFEMLNHVGRQSFAASFNASENYHGNVLEQYDQGLNERLPQTFDSLRSRELVSEDNSILQHPAISPLVDTVRKGFESRYPDASPREIASATSTYFKKMVKDLNSSQSQSDNGNNRNGNGQNSSVPRGGKPSLVTSDFEGFELDEPDTNQKLFG